MVAMGSMDGRRDHLSPHWASHGYAGNPRLDVACQNLFQGCRLDSIVFRALALV